MLPTCMVRCPPNFRIDHPATAVAKYWAVTEGVAFLEVCPNRACMRAHGIQTQSNSADGMLSDMQMAQQE
jgi:hypothetical protein